ncbi:MAG: hypothetical protein MZU91_00450 [Desulfosudis oleivorans]|nr:hypothetical protein [Desulfosudis oleivorans]
MSSWGANAPAAPSSSATPRGTKRGRHTQRRLAFAKGDWNFETLDPEKDYSMEDMDYDFKNHVPVSSHRGGLCGKLVFREAESDTGGNSRWGGFPPQGVRGR